MCESRSLCIALFRDLCRGRETRREFETGLNTLRLSEAATVTACGAPIDHVTNDRTRTGFFLAVWGLRQGIGRFLLTRFSFSYGLTVFVPRSGRLDPLQQILATLRRSVAPLLGCPVKLATL